MMKKILFIFISLFCLKYNYALSQDVKIKWEDSDGREFSIKTISGEFEWGMVGGDNISYDTLGRVNKVGNVIISYDTLGRVNKVGNVIISYRVFGGVNKVGNLTVKYGATRRFLGTSGKVN